ncbi:enoyl-CoA hydratase/isomerase family protein [Bradyrhizobium nitroreducens]|uniref:enoyl-CoA hydratase/isomerase family protein n=1 Tax=Bradyrhizobium nitroreducens TaxID=709803 RepID=UPI000C1E4D1E|nr:enoyl-CoA hydratase/isomerase family protein [Bradyrhizobium nitroreducens]
MKADTSEITCDRRAGVALITLNRPQARNPLSLSFAASLLDLLDELERDDSVSVIVLTGAGSVFCSGAQLGEVVSIDGIDSEIQLRNIRGFSKVVQRLRDLDLPVVAALNGPAVGGGAALALACDIAIGSDQATYFFAFGRVGAGANDMGCAYFLPKLVGAARARHWLLTGATVSADEAYKAGLLIEVTPPDRLIDRALEIAQSVTAASPRRAAAVTKLAINRGEDADLQTCLSYEVYLQTFLFTRDEHKDRLKTLLTRLGSG